MGKFVWDFVAMSQRLLLLILLICTEVTFLVVLLRFYLSIFTPAT